MYLQTNRNGHGAGVRSQQIPSSMLPLHKTFAMSKLSRLLNLASQGNPKAISAIISRSLKSDGIRAIAKLDQGCLHVILEGGEIPDRAFSWYVSERVEGFGARVIESLHIYGRQIGDPTIAWQTEMASTPPVNVFETATASDLLVSSPSSANEPSFSSPLLDGIPQPFDEAELFAFGEESLNRDLNSAPATDKTPSPAKMSADTTARNASAIDSPTASEILNREPAPSSATSFFEAANNEPIRETSKRTDALLAGNNRQAAAADKDMAADPLTHSTDNRTVVFSGEDNDADDVDRVAATNASNRSVTPRGFPLLDSETQAKTNNAILLSSEEDISSASPQQETVSRNNDDPSAPFWGNGDAFANVDFGENQSSDPSPSLTATPQTYGEAFTEAELAELAGELSSDAEHSPEPLANELDDNELDIFTEAELTETELAELARSKQSLPLSKAAIAIALLACAALSGLGGLYLFRSQWLPQSASQTVASPDVATADGTDTLTTTTPVASPVTQTRPSTQSSSAPAQPFHAAVNQAIKAANLTQSATTQTDWQTVTDRWQNAIAFLEAVPDDSPQYITAQEKIAEYQKNLNYAQQKLAALAP